LGHTLGEVNIQILMSSTLVHQTGTVVTGIHGLLASLLAIEPFGSNAYFAGLHGIKYYQHRLELLVLYVPFLSQVTARIKFKMNGIINRIISVKESIRLATRLPCTRNSAGYLTTMG